jgi:hypothetical protein
MPINLSKAIVRARDKVRHIRAGDVIPVLVFRVSAPSGAANRATLFCVTGLFDLQVSLHVHISTQHTIHWLSSKSFASRLKKSTEDIS